MKKRVVFLLMISIFFVFSTEAKKIETEKVSDRQYWCDLTYKISYPVLNALSKGELKKTMPVEQQKNASGRENFAHLEALARLLCGIAPWLESGESAGREGTQREELTALAIKGIRNAVDSDSPDYMNFNGQKGGQPLVDAAFLAQAFLRSPNVLWGGLDREIQRMVITAMSQFCAGET